MQVIAITPIHVTDAELYRRQARYNRISPKGLTVKLQNFSQLEPKELGLPSDVISSDLVLRNDMNSINIQEFDFIMPDCILDPGFRKGDNEFIVGMLESVMSHLAKAGHQIGAVTRNEIIGAELVRRVNEYGYSEHFIGLEVLNLDFEAISDDELWHRSLEIAVENLAVKGASVVINGCSAVNLGQSRFNLEVVDPAEMALKLIMDYKNGLETEDAKI